MGKIYTKEESYPLEERLSVFCKENNILFENNTDITEICNKFRIDTVAMPLDDEQLDGLILIDQKYRFIATNVSLSVEDSRFVIAHELAHFLSKSVKQNNQHLLFAERDRVFHGGKKIQEEQDMDYLAAAMLMPKDQFMLELNLFHLDLKHINEASMDESKNEILVDKVKNYVNPIILSFFAHRYNVREEVVVRRIAEVSYYA